MDAEKLEKVMKGLECCSIGLYCPDEECPYEKDKEEKQENCIALLARDALEVLKALEPRVMTLDEVKTWVSSDPDLRDPIFYEDSILKRGWWITHDNDCVYLPSVNAGYGRCWTSRPTDEQRTAVKWDD